MMSVWPLLLSSAAYLASIVVVDAIDCPDNTWVAHKDQSCIKIFSNSKLPWDGAREACQKAGAELIHIKDADMNTFVKGLLGSDKERYWIGISDDDVSGQYAYTNGNTLSSFQSWRKGEPNSRPTTRNCVEMIGNRNGVWKVKPCRQRRRYICQKEVSKMEKWDDLKVTWGQPGMPGSSNFFNSMPRTSQDALSQGFKKISDCDRLAKWRGSRYVQNDDYALVLLYDINGYIAGIQIVVPSGQANGYPFPNIQPPFLKDGDNFLLTAYFVNPDTICTHGRSARDFDSQGTGTELYIQNGTYAERDSIQIPLVESGLAQTKWTRGRCMPTMGVHYWYDSSEDMNCEDTFPVFLLYNKGRLNAFGWAMAADMSSKRLEHPPKAVFPIFFDPVPKCLYNYDSLSTMHIYMTSNVLANKC